MSANTQRIIAIVIAAIVTSISTFAADPLLPNEKWALSDDNQLAWAYELSADSIILQIEPITPPLIMQSQTAGLVAYFDLTAKKKEKYRVNFPVIPGFGQILMEVASSQGKGAFGPFGQRPPQEQGDDQQAPDRDMPMPDFKQTVIDDWSLPDEVKLLLIGDNYASFFVDKSEQNIPINDVFIAYTEDGRIFYSCKLPLSRLGDKRNKKGLINLGIAIKEMDIPMDGEMQRMSPPGGGMGGPGGGMGGGPRGGMGGPGAGMRPSDGQLPNRQKPKSYKLWLEIQ